MSANDPALWPTVRQVAAIRAGELKSRELLERYIDRIEQLNPVINAVITTDFDNARKQADAFDKRGPSGGKTGLLPGIPITVKDALETAGLRSTGGATELRDNIPARDAPVVSSVKREGAIVFGKTNLPRWSGDIQAYNELFGTTNNPWDIGKVPGGSSGGAAAAVSAGLTSFEIGTDIGGSIRFPSAFCGVFGHKPSFGIVPGTGYLDHEQGGLVEADINVIGPIARSAGDLKLLLDIMKRGTSPLTTQLRPAVPAPKLRVAAWLDDEACRVDDEVLERLTATVEALRGDGIDVNTDARPDIDVREASYIGSQLVLAGMSWVLPEAPLRHTEWLELHRRREEIRLKWSAFFQDYDIILVPVSFVPPFEHQHEGDFMTRTLACNNETRAYLDLVFWTTLIGMAYLPSTVPPIGAGRSGLPIGIQVVGAYGADYTTIQAAEHIAALMGGYRPPPMAQS